MFTPDQLKRTQTDTLEIAYFELTKQDAPAAIFLHGWPDDAHSWWAVAQALNDAGWRVIAPYLRGFGPTRFLSDDTMRSGDLSALAQDLLDLADALKIDRFAVVGHDWGARAAYIAACVAPERISHCVGLSVGWGTNDPNQVLSLKQVQNYWYQWYMAMDRGAELVRNDRRTFTQHIWEQWCIARKPDETALARLFAAFDNPDWAEIVLHSYRVRWGLVASDPTYDALADQVKADPAIRVPTLCIHGGSDPCNAPSTSEGKKQFFVGPYERQVLDGIGHFPQLEAPDDTARALIGFLGER